MERDALSELASQADYFASVLKVGFSLYVYLNSQSPDQGCYAGNKFIYPHYKMSRKSFFEYFEYIPHYSVFSYLLNEVLLIKMELVFVEFKTLIP